MELALPWPASKITAYFRYGLAAQLTLVVLISIGAYTGTLPTSIPGLPHSDLFGHAVLIGPLAFFLDGALGFRPAFRALPALRLAPLLVAAAAGLEEYAQRFSARRDSCWSDFFADLLGIVIFSWLARRLADALR
jgi:hypothetical protein